MKQRTLSRRLTAALLALMMALSLTACGAAPSVTLADAGQDVSLLTPGGESLHGGRRGGYLPLRHGREGSEPPRARPPELDGEPARGPRAMSCAWASARTSRTR